MATISVTYVIRDGIVETHGLHNTHQECKKCKVKVYPYRQKKLEKTELGEHSTKEHPQHLCGKCQKLGYNCRLKEDKRRHKYH